MLASDIYSVGAMLYQMLTGSLPYFSPNPAQIERMIAQGRCTPPKLRNCQIPREISDIVMKATAPDLGDRYQRASELLDDLATAGDIDHNATEMEDIRRASAREVPEEGLLLALSKAPARAVRDLRLLRRKAVPSRKRSPGVPRGRLVLAGDQGPPRSKKVCDRRSRSRVASPRQAGPTTRTRTARQSPARTATISSMLASPQFAG